MLTRTSQGIERVEELLLALLTFLEELDVIDEQNIDRTVFFAKCVNTLVLQRIDILIKAGFSCQIENAQIGTCLFELVVNSMYLVCLTQSGSTMDEKRVVTEFARMFNDSFSRCMCPTVRRTNHEFVERVVVIQRQS